MKLLIVDDNEQNLYMLQELLEGHGHEVVPAGDGAEALEVARRDPPDMIISDILMPVMDGFSLCRQWKVDEGLKGIPFIFCTATYTDPKDEEFALSLGAERFIVKPAEPDVFMEMVREVCENYETGQLAAPREPVEEEAVYFKEYNEALIRKLEDKMLQLEEANQALERDIIERKRAEEELRRYREHLEEMVKERTQKLRDAQEQLVRQEKLAVLGQLAGGVGHELRNPLGAISNAAYYLAMALDDPEPGVQEMLDILQREVKVSEGIISGLLDFARGKAPTRRKVGLDEIVQLALTGVEIPENVQVVSELDPALPAVLADPDQLRQVFGNLILNAVQAMPAGGELVIRTETPGEHQVAVAFTDSGEGIPEENLGKLFEPLFTTKARGIGLGLAIAKTLVEGQGGAIEVQSQLGQGSTFTVRLPLGASAAVEG